MAREQAEYEAKIAAREAKAKASGKKLGGKPPAPPTAGPGPSDQINLTDEDSRIMPVAGGGFEQCYNAQAVVAADSLLVVAADVVQATNSLPSRRRGTSSNSNRCWVSWRLCRRIWAHRKRCSATTAISVPPMWRHCAAAGIEPLLALGRAPHHPSLDERFAAAPPAPENPTPLQAMVHRLATPEGKKLYGQRKHTPEPVFGIIKSVLGFRQFLPRGLDKVRGEWSLVTMAWNMKRIFALNTR